MLNTIGPALSSVLFLMLRRTLLTGILTFSIPVNATEALASKATLKTGFQILNNQGTAGGSASGGSGFDLSWTQFLNRRLAVTGGYATNFNLTEKTLTTNGFYLEGRYYLNASGTRVAEKTEVGSVVIHSTWSPYVATAFSYNSYFLGKDPLGTAERDTLEGSYAAADLRAGVDYRISKNYEWNLSGVYSVLTFAAQDERVRIQHMSILIGLNVLIGGEL